MTTQEIINNQNRLKLRLDTEKELLHAAETSVRETTQEIEKAPLYFIEGTGHKDIPLGIQVIGSKDYCQKWLLSHYPSYFFTSGKQIDCEIKAGYVAATLESVCVSNSNWLPIVKLWKTLGGE